MIRSAPSRRSVLAGLAAAPLAPASAASAPDPGLGPNVVLLDPAMPSAVVQARLNAIFRRQERAEFGDGRCAILLKPGRYTLDMNVGFYTQVAGLGELPDDVVVDGHVHCEADWAGGIALVNFWRGVENLSVRPPDRVDRWAVSQAAPYRRIHLAGDLLLDDGGWSSGGFIADSRIEGTVRSGSQQQWFTRASALGAWQGANWNMAFEGVVGAPASTFPEPPITSLPSAELIREKPFLYLAGHDWRVFVPAVRRSGVGPSWSDGPPPGRSLPLSVFLVARPDTPVSAINAALASGRHLLLTPGIYTLSEPIRVIRAGTVVLGLGLATLRPINGTPALTVGNAPGVTVAGLLIDAGPINSPVLVRIGSPHGGGGNPADPTLLADLFVRVGGATVGNAGTGLEINASHVIGDHLWLWRADHGDRPGERVHVGWSESRGARGLVVNGDDVTMHGLFVEHWQEHQVLWTGERGRTCFFQCELPYDPPGQAAWRADRRGWAAYKVADSVRSHEAVALGVYANFTADPDIVLASAIEAPRAPGVRFASVTTISLGGGKGIIAHLVDGAGAAAKPGAIRQTLSRWP